jgi:rubrerythrin
MAAVGEYYVGYRRLKPGTAAFAGVLRKSEKGAVTWACAHSHAVTRAAYLCAEAEAVRRREAARVVYVLLHCGTCGLWWDDSRGALRCPRCEKPLDRVKLAEVERHRAA